MSADPAAAASDAPPDREAGALAASASWWVPLLLALAVFAAFSPALDARFVNWDDDLNLVENQAFRGVGSEHLTWMLTTNHMGPYQPLAWLSLGVDHALWGLGPGLDPPQAGAYHRTSVLIHVLAALAFFLLARRLFTELQGTRAGAALTIAAGLAALVFAVHPLRAESVAWVTERRDVLSGLFLALAVHAYLVASTGRESDGERATSPRSLAVTLLGSLAAALLFQISVDTSGETRLSGRGPGGWGLAAAALALTAATLTAPAGLGTASASRRAWYSWAVGAFLLSLGSKGLGMTLPAVLLVVDLGLLRRWKPGAGPARLVALVVEKAPLVALSLAAGRLAMWGQKALPDVVRDWQTHTLSERLAQSAYGLGFYPARTLWPRGLSAMVPLPFELSWSEPRFWLSALVVVLVSAALIALRRRAAAPLAAWLSFGLLVGPVLGLSQAGDQLVADRYSYLSCMPFALLAGGGWLALWGARPALRTALAAGALLAALALGVATRRQTATWHDSETLWSHAREVDESNPYAWLQLANFKRDEATRASDEGLRERLLEDAIALYRRAFELNPRPTPTYVLNYGSALLQAGRFEEAVPVLESFVSSSPGHARGRTNLGTALMAAGRLNDARAQLEEAVRLEPGYARGWLQLAQLHEQAGRPAEARAAYRRVTELWPNYRPAKRKLAELGG